MQSINARPASNRSIADSDYRLIKVKDVIGRNAPRARRRFLLSKNQSDISRKRQQSSVTIVPSSFVTKTIMKHTNDQYHTHYLVIRYTILTFLFYRTRGMKIQVVIQQKPRHAAVSFVITPTVERDIRASTYVYVSRSSQVVDRSRRK